MKELTHTKIAAEVAQKLLQIKAIKLSPQNPFTWASGLKSPIYCDNRIVLSHPDIRRIVLEGLIEISEAFRPFDVIAGVATAGIAHGALLANALNLPFIYVRNKAKGHGRQNQIEGEIQGGERVLVVEDLISTGGSCLQAVEALREARTNVCGVMAIFTYGFERAEKAFEEANCPYTTLTNYHTLIQEAVESQYINESDLLSLGTWRKDPANWSAGLEQ
ncbi:MAG: orotate phosphoribosyltransferase [Bacteroidota bacterium]